MSQETSVHDKCTECVLHTGFKKLIVKITRIVQYKIKFLEVFIAPLALLWARFYMARLFWKSGQTKITNMDSAAQLFEWEYIPLWEENSKSVFGLDLTWTVPDPAIAATLATYSELGLPVLLLLGLGTRFAALGLLGMSLTIELLIYPGTTEHYFWMTILLLIMAVGPGKISADHFLRKKFFANKATDC